MSGAHSERVNRLVSELNTVRRQGLPHAILVEFDALRDAAVNAGVATGEELTQPVLRTLLVQAIARLDGQVAYAAELTFGLKPGTSVLVAGERRKRAADAYDRSTPEVFRKKHEPAILRAVAEEILELSRPEPVSAAPANDGDAPILAAAVQGMPIGSARWLATNLPAGPGKVLLHRAPVETLTDIDVIVSSENVALEMGKTFTTSMSGTLRLAAAQLGTAGRIIDDVLQRELRQWLAAEGLEGLRVSPGTVIPTSPGELRGQGVRRIYHGAVAAPSLDTYVVAPWAVSRVVAEAFKLFTLERNEFAPPLRSICFPLFGAGHGGLTPESSAKYLWRALSRELSHVQDVDVHLVTRSEAGSRALLEVIGAPATEPE